MTTLTITRPDDWHVHLRDGDVLKDTVNDIGRYFGRAIIMPNLVPPVMNAQQASEYYDRIQAVNQHDNFEPLMGGLDQFWPQVLAELGIVGTVVYAGIIISFLVALYDFKCRSETNESKNYFKPICLFQSLLSQNKYSSAIRPFSHRAMVAIFSLTFLPVG